MPIVLASGSPRRRELLALITEDFTVCPVDADETLRPGAPLDEEVVRLSCLKAQAAQGLHPDALCIGSDTMVTIDGLPLGKPADEKQAAEMLRRLRGLCEQALAAPLEMICNVDFRRCAVLLQEGDTVCELALDEGTLRHGGRTAPLCEIELEYVAGGEQAFHDLAAELAGHLSLIPEPESKLARAMKL